MDEQAVALPGPEQGQQVGVTDVPHQLDGAHFHPTGAVAQPDEFQRDVETAGACRPPA